jgi:hypothetical protein
MSTILMTIKGSLLLSNSWKQELQISDDGVYGETLVVGKRVKMHLAYENIAQVNVLRGILTADIEIVNKGGSGNLVIKAVNKSEAEECRKIIEQKISEIQTVRKTQNNENISIADEIKKLATLKDQKIITEEEFDLKKKQLLGI